MSSRRQYVIPTHYAVHLTTDLESGLFFGSVQIDFSMKQSHQTYIRLDTSHLKIELSSISLSRMSDSSALHCSAALNESDEYLQITLAESSSLLADTSYRLKIPSFSGHITTDSQIGFYRSTIETSSSSEKKHYGITQMSPTHCRRVFPCFDEPSLRATFDLILDVPRHLQALSNMPPLYSPDNLFNSEVKRIHFQRTPSMPTFLLCFVIGEFDMVKSEPVERLKKDSGLSPIELTAYTIPGRKHEAKFALNCARKALHYYADLFQIDYPMSKLDLVAVPDLFYPAMEDWALILFKEEEMLINEDHASSVQYRNVCQSVTHEIAHQWFGNLVSIDWWNDVYVIEGFAKWFEYLATDYIIPECNVFSEFFSTQFVRYFDYCIYILHNEANDLEEKDFAFEGFIYSKGSCLMRMLHLFVGQERFLDGVRLFLQRFAYKTATAIQFWECIEEVTGLPIKQLIHTWCMKKSYPVVQVKMLDCDDKTGNSRLELTQMSFCGGHEQENKPLEKKISCHCFKTTTNEHEQNWIIPITISNNQIDSPSEKFLMRQQREIFTLNNTLISSSDEPSTKKRRHSSSWFKLNICSGGPYRVFYSSDMLDNLIEAMNKQELNTFDRFNIENDMYALAMGGFTSLVDYLRLLLKAYMNEIDDELVWKDIENNLIRIATLLEYDKQLYEFYQRFILYFHRNLYRIIGFTSKINDQQQDESIARVRLRCFLLVILGTIGYDPTIISNAREQLQIYLSDSTVTVLWPICAIVAHHASDTDLNSLFKLWEQRTNRDDRLRCAYGLSYVQNSSHIQRVLGFFAIDNPHHHMIRLTERIECYKGFCLSKQGRYHYQRYVTNHWSILRKHFNDDNLETLIRETFGYFSTKDEAESIENFFLSNEISDEKCLIPAKETPATPCTRIAVHLSLDDNELSSINRSALPSPVLPSRPNIPDKVRDIASNIAHTTRTRAALLERDRDHLLAFFQSETVLLTMSHANSSSQIRSVNPIINASNIVSPCSTTTGTKRKRRISLNTTNSSPPVRNLLASDTSV